MLQPIDDVGKAQENVQLDRHRYLKAAITRNYFVGLAPNDEGETCHVIKFPNFPNLKPVRDFQPLLYRNKSPEPVTDTIRGEITFSSQQPNIIPRKRDVSLGDSLSRQTSLPSPRSVSFLIDAELVGQMLAGLESDARFREGGILYLIGHSNLFWSMMLLWHRSGSTGHSGWDFVLKRIISDPSNPDLIDCMFFCTPFGCLTHSCQYVHSQARKDACNSFEAVEIARSRHSAIKLDLKLHFSRCQELIPIRESAAEIEEEEHEQLLQRLLMTLPNLSYSNSSDISSSISTKLSEFDHDSESTQGLVEIEGSTLLRRRGAIRTSGRVRGSSPIRLGMQTKPKFTQQLVNTSVKIREVFCSRCEKQEDMRINDKFKLCSQCRLVRYCSRTCQELDWPDHIDLCMKTNVPSLSPVLRHQKKISTL
ncbi:hypothetical protein HK096_001184 [Nowakowskiella sp. JEL0078]|nr:hypothetical protein HK096_001184 [Nowakowskiella sp. JEL0078]